jgi:hypothetical protein
MSVTQGVLCSALALLFAVACGSGTEEEAAQPPPAPAAVLPAPVPFDLTGLATLISTPDEPISRVALASFQKAGVDVSVMDALVVPYFGREESFLILDFEPAKGKPEREPGGTLKALREVAGLDILKRSKVNRIAINVRAGGSLRSVTLSWSGFEERIGGAAVQGDALAYLLASPNADVVAGSDPELQAALQAPAIIDAWRVAEAVRRGALLGFDATLLDEAIRAQPYHSKYLLYKAAQEVAFGGDAERTKGQALFLFQKQLPPGGTASNAMQPPDADFLIKYQATLQDRLLSLNFDPKAPAYHNLLREFCLQERLLITYKQPASTRCS